MYVAGWQSSKHFETHPLSSAEGWLRSALRLYIVTDSNFSVFVFTCNLNLSRERAREHKRLQTCTGTAIKNNLNQMDAGKLPQSNHFRAKLFPTNLPAPRLAEREWSLASHTKITKQGFVSSFWTRVRQRTDQNFHRRYGGLAPLTLLQLLLAQFALKFHWSSMKFSIFLDSQVRHGRATVQRIYFRPLARKLCRVPWTRRPTARLSQPVGSGNHP